VSLEKFIRAGSAILGQAPGAIAAISKYNVSIYQPAIYKGSEYLLVVPLAVGIVATWFAHKFSAIAMWVLLPLTLVLAAAVYYVYTNFEATDRIHQLNWALSYCVAALVAAILYRFLVDVIH
jgi:hypothetical protein